MSLNLTQFVSPALQHIPIYAAYLFDAVTLYANAVHQIITNDMEVAAKSFNVSVESLWPSEEKVSELLKDGASIINRIRNHTYQSQQTKNLENRELGFNWCHSQASLARRLNSTKTETRRATFQWSACRTTIWLSTKISRALSTCCRWQSLSSSTTPWYEFYFFTPHALDEYFFNLKLFDSHCF